MEQYMTLFVIAPGNDFEIVVPFLKQPLGKKPEKIRKAWDALPPDLPARVP